MTKAVPHGTFIVARVKAPRVGPGTSVRGPPVSATGRGDLVTGDRADDLSAASIRMDAVGRPIVDATTRMGLRKI